VGGYKPVTTQGALLAYLRECGEQRLLIVLNLGSRPAHLPLTEIGQGAGEIVLATDARREGERVSRRLVMLGDDAIVIRLG